jgi:hypothetical protein
VTSTAITPVPGLLTAGRPAHIAGFIVTVVVNAIQAVFSAWTRTDVRDERFEQMAPFVTDPNSTSSVRRIFLVLHVITAFAHVAPASVLRRFFDASRSLIGRMSVRRLARFRHRVSVTPTRFNPAVNQVARFCTYRLPAVAPALNKAMPCACGCHEGDDSQAFKPITDGQASAYAASTRPRTRAQQIAGLDHGVSAAITSTTPERVPVTSADLFNGNQKPEALVHLNLAWHAAHFTALRAA